ncbi:MAG: LamG domain-containing protein [Chitinophagaceae bacterium]
MDRPQLGDYPKDNPTLPGGPLRFYVSFDSTSPEDKQLNIRFSDSISGNPSFFPDASISYGPGVRGTAMQGSTSKGSVQYISANDFGKATSFTIALWMNVTLAQKDNSNAEGVLAVSSTTNFWGNATIFVDHNTTVDTMDLKFHFANGTGDNWDFAGYTGANGLTGMYDGQWHHITFTYDATSKTGTLYKDGVQFSQKTNEIIAFDGNDSKFILGGFQEAASIVSTYGDNSWMSAFPGLIDNVRLYNVALSASDVAALYNNKQ